MAHKKAAGSTKNVGGSQPKYLGVKIADGAKTSNGEIILRQRGTQFLAGKGTKLGVDHTIYSVAEGKVKFSKTRRKRFDGTVSVKPIVSVL